MTKQDRDRAEARVNKTTKPTVDAGKSDRDAAAKAVLDNMAKLRALRLAREATDPPRPSAARKTVRAKKKPGEKGPALADWLASQQNGGRRI